MIKTGSLLTAALVAAVVLHTQACRREIAQESTDTDRVLARVNGHPITADAIPAVRDPSRQDLRSRLEFAIQRRIAAEEARRRGLAATPEMRERLAAIHQEAAAREEAALRDALFARMKGDLTFSDQDLRDQYEKTKIRFATKELHLRRATFRSKAEAEAVLAKLGPEGRLEPAASEEIGPAPIEKLPQAVLPEALQLQRPGDRAIVERGSEAAIVELVEILPAEPRPFEEVRDKVDESLRTLRGQEAFNKELERLRAEAKVEIDEAALRGFTSQAATPSDHRP
ncbi:MAG TPA: peptidyl-prolyl cis-trans isomerase [Myxococcota bacterium]|nr:peptidyl-prolyl cis-trans isomerase [Myxococcota bacterium]